MVIRKKLRGESYDFESIDEVIRDIDQVLAAQRAGTLKVQGKLDCRSVDGTPGRVDRIWIRRLSR